ncbi:MAG: hypothetical protein AAGG68_23320 [Bacteroidota bacterium]
MRRNFFILLVILFWIAVLFIGSISFYLKKANTITKKAVLAGYAKGTMVDYQLLLYEDSTYYLSTLQLIGYDGVNEWFVHNDTMKLEYQNTVAAKIHKNKLIEHNYDKFKCLSVMEFKHFNPSKIVKFPKHR